MLPNHYIVGDIHGCLAELEALELKIIAHAKRNKSRAVIVSVGDLVDRGPCSAEVVRHFMTGSASGTHVAVAGNHEAEFLLTLHEWSPSVFLNAAVSPPVYLSSYQQQHRDGQSQFAKNLTLAEFRLMRRLMWIGQGGASTLISYGCNPTDEATWKIPPDELRFLCSLPLVWECEKAVVTHALATSAAIATGKKIDQGRDVSNSTKDVDSLLWNRKHLDVRPDELRTHVSGHTPLERSKLNRKTACLQIDTGCVYGRNLTAWCVETGSFLRVKAKKSYA